MAPPPSIAMAPLDDAVLIDRLRHGDGDAFCALVQRHDPALQRFAHSRSDDPAIAADAVQDTWLAVIQGIDGFLGRSTFRGWLYGILLNRLRSRQRREKRFVPLSVLPGVEADGARPSPEGAVLDREMREVIDRAIAGLPPGQREVITLRDVQGCTASEACARLGVTACNQRVLLHRARGRVRRAVERYRAQ